MSETTHHKHHEPFWPYAICAVVLLAILTGAILAPDYLNYRYRRDRLQHSADTSALKSAPSTPVTISATAPAGGSGSTVSLDASKASPKSNDIGDGELLKSSSIYETYAKLVTMMLGFVSVVGLLAGYFVRKSVSELTEEVRNEAAREVKTFERERTDALAKVRDAEDSTKKALAEATKIKNELDELLKKTSVQLNPYRTLKGRRRTFLSPLVR